MTIGEQIARKHQELCKERKTNGISNRQNGQVKAMGELLDVTNGGRQPRNADHRATCASKVNNNGR